MGLIFDTDYFIAAERAGIETLVPVALRHQSMGISAITLSELYVGLYRAGSPARRKLRQRFVDTVLGNFTAFDFTKDIAKTHGSLRAKLAVEGRLIGAHDLIIAATAIHFGWSIVTGNLREFRRIPNLTVIDRLTFSAS